MDLSKERCRFLKLESSRSLNASAMATSFVGPFFTDKAFSTAPVPRPPQPTRATRTVFSSPAWTGLRVMPANAEAAATAPDRLSISRRLGMEFWLTTNLLRTGGWVNGAGTISLSDPQEKVNHPLPGIDRCERMAIQGGASVPYREAIRARARTDVLVSCHHADLDDCFRSRLWSQRLGKSGLARVSRAAWRRPRR